MGTPMFQKHPQLAHCSHTLNREEHRQFFGRGLLELGVNKLPPGLSSFLSC